MERGRYVAVTSRSPILADRGSIPTVVVLTMSDQVRNVHSSDRFEECMTRARIRPPRIRREIWMKVRGPGADPPLAQAVPLLASRPRLPGPQVPDRDLRRRDGQDVHPLRGLRHRPSGSSRRPVGGPFRGPRGRFRTSSAQFSQVDLAGGGVGMRGRARSTGAKSTGPSYRRRSRLTRGATFREGRY